MEVEKSNSCKYVILKMKGFRDYIEESKFCKFVLKKCQS